MLNVVAIKISKKFLEPFVHDLMVGPPMIELCEKNGTSLPCLVAQGGKNVRCEVALDSFSVPLVELTRPIVR